MKTHHNYVFIQIFWYFFFVYNIIQTSCFFFLETSTHFVGCLCLLKPLDLNLVKDAWISSVACLDKNSSSKFQFHLFEVNFYWYIC